MVNKILEIIKTCNEHLNEGGKVITSALLKSFNIPDFIQNLIKEDYKLFSEIVNFYKDNFKIVSENNSDLCEALEQIEFIRLKSNKKKEKFILYNEIILPWLKKDDFFINIFETYNIQEINPEKLKPLVEKKFKIIPRDSQYGKKIDFNLNYELIKNLQTHFNEFEKN